MTITRRRVFRLLLIVVGFSQMGFSLKDYKKFAAAAYYIVVDKSDNTLTIYDARDWLVQYPCTFGSTDLGDKMTQGRSPDTRRPLPDHFQIPAQKWDKFMRLNYPTEADITKFNQRKAAGVIPKTAKIGGDIGIHGTWPHEEWAVENLQSWTLGCVSMKNEDINELYSMVGPGTVVIIRR